MTRDNWTQTIIQMENEHVVQSYVRPDFVLTHGQGVTLYDETGKAYQDWVAGIAVNALGYGDADLNEVIASHLLSGVFHVSNLYHSAPHAQLARALTERSFADRVLFCNSGAEATEAALKFARKVAYEKGRHAKTDLVSFTGGFHGRTMGALALTPREKYQKPFAPMMPGAVVADFNDLDSARAAINERTAAVIVEPVQGEGGVNVADADFLRGLRQLCDAHDALLIFDEVQCGLGRTGTLWAHEPSGVTPDIMTLAKPLAVGLPIGAVLVTEAVGQAIKPGDHGSTFAGGLLVTRVAEHVVQRVSAPDFLEHVQQVGAYLRERLEEINSPLIVEVRGRGLMVAVELNVEAAPFIKRGYEEGLLLVNAGAQVLRFVPPLVVTESDVDALADKLTRVLGGGHE